VLVFVDKLTSMMHIAPCKKSCSAKEAAQLLFEHVIKVHGVPLGQFSDRDPRSTGQYWRQLCAALRISPKLSSAFHPQTDRTTEKDNRTIKDMMRNLVSEGGGGDRLLGPLIAIC
jgi:hypothetical protein